MNSADPLGPRILVPFGSATPANQNPDWKRNPIPISHAEIQTERTKISDFLFLNLISQA
jgi:hypothetical protein